MDTTAVYKEVISEMHLLVCIYNMAAAFGDTRLFQSVDSQQVKMGIKI